MNFSYYRFFIRKLKNSSKYKLINYLYYKAKKQKQLFNQETFNQETFNNLYPDFNYLLYGVINKDLIGYTKFKLQKHFYLYGKNENRIYSINKFYEIYPDFDIEYYKNFNNLNMDNLDYFYIHFINIGLKINKKLLGYDFEINNYYENTYPNNFLHETNIMYRKIQDIDQLSNYQKKYIK